jgi:ubiquinone/menaquinone biosynthesis C-methylase UbiE
MSNTDICSAEHAGALDNWLRRLLQNPKKLLAPFLFPEMSMVDFGCGPGFFTLAASEMVGQKGKVFAVDVQEAMLDIVQKKLASKQYSLQAKLKNIFTIKTNGVQFKISDPVDLVWAFYMVHETGDLEGFFKQAKEILKPDGKLVIFEPKFHVSKKKFSESVAAAKNEGFIYTKELSGWISRGGVFTFEKLN